MYHSTPVYSICTPKTNILASYTRQQTTIHSWKTSKVSILMKRSPIKINEELHFIYASNPREGSLTLPSAILEKSVPWPKTHFLNCGRCHPSQDIWPRRTLVAITLTMFTSKAIKWHLRGHKFTSASKSLWMPTFTETTTGCQRQLNIGGHEIFSITLIQILPHNISTSLQLCCLS